MFIRVHANGLDDWLNDFRNAMDERWDVLGLDPAELRVKTADPTPWPRSSLVLHFQERSRRYAPPTDLADAFADALAAGRAVIPVVADAALAGSLPPAIAHLNAFVVRRHGREWAAALANEVLGRLWLQRRAKKVFISYRRDESRAMARQLCDELTRLGYEVFLDEGAISTGADFLHEIGWWLVDADLVVLLASPGIGKSAWVRQEIDLANAWSIGVLAICWDPVVALAQSLSSDQRYTLRRAPTADEELLPGELAEALAKLDAQRLHSVGQKLNDVLVYARDSYSRSQHGPVPISSGLSFGDFQIDPPALNGIRRYVRVLPFRPTPDALWALDQAITTDPTCSAVEAMSCFYLESDPRDPRANALRWLVERERQDIPELPLDLDPFDPRRPGGTP